MKELKHKFQNPKKSIKAKPKQVNHFAFVTKDQTVHRKKRDKQPIS